LDAISGSACYTALQTCKKFLCINPVITESACKSHKEVIKCAPIINYALKSEVAVVLKSFVAMLHSLHGNMNNSVRNFSSMNSVATEKAGKTHDKTGGKLYGVFANQHFVFSTKRT